MNTYNIKIIYIITTWIIITVISLIVISSEYISYLGFKDCDQSIILINFMSHGITKSLTHGAYSFVIDVMLQVGRYLRGD